MGASVFLCVFIIIKRFFHSIVFLLSFYQKFPQKWSPTKRQSPPTSIIRFLPYKSLYLHSRGAKKIATVFDYKFFQLQMCYETKKETAFTVSFFRYALYLFYGFAPERGNVAA